MPAQEETSTVTVKTWTLNTIADVRDFQDDMFGLGLVATVWRHPEAPAEQQARVQVDIPDRPNGPILVDTFGTVLRAITMANSLISLDKVES
jgi:hypothetical protein